MCYARGVRDPKSYVSWHRREPWSGRIVVTAFAWAPLWLAAGVYASKGLGIQSALAIGAMIAFAPFVIGAVWLTTTSMKKAEPFVIAFILLHILVGLGLWLYPDLLS